MQEEDAMKRLQPKYRRVMYATTLEGKSGA